MLIPIHHLEDPRLDPYRELKRTNRTRWSGTFIAEGRKVVERLVASHYETQSLLVSRRQLHYLPSESSLGDIPAYVLEQPLAEQLVGYNFHAGVLGCGVRRPALEIESMLAGLPAQTVLVACSRVTDPDNLGNIIRLCSGFGVGGLILGPGCADPFSRRVLRVSMGNLLHLPVRETEDLVADLQYLHKERFDSVATVLDNDARSLRHFAAPKRNIVLLGNESDGLEPELVALATHRVTIPMQPHTDSLNVSLAAGIVLYELTSNRRD